MSYLFICNGTPQHKSYSASREQYDSSCPECSAPTILVDQVEIAPVTNIWYPGPDYKGREGVYAKTVGELPDEDTTTLVRHRAQEDGEWTIENGLVADHAKYMRKMMAWVADPTNIAQCLEHLYKDEEAHIRTVDWVCRDLANASKAIVGGIAHHD